jgi:putative membrane protein
MSGAVLFILKMFIVALFVVLGVLVTVLNPGELTLNYFYGEITLPVSSVLAITLGIGLLLGYLISCLMSLKEKMRVHKLEKQAETTQAELQNLRQIPPVE